MHEELRQVDDAARPGLTGEAAKQHARLLGHMAAIPAIIERIKTYPAHIMGRADLLDRASGLAKMSRQLIAKIAPPPKP